MAIVCVCVCVCACLLVCVYVCVCVCVCVCVWCDDQGVSGDDEGVGGDNAVCVCGGGVGRGVRPASTDSIDQFPGKRIGEPSLFSRCAAQRNCLTRHNAL